MGCCKHGRTDGECGLCFAEELADVNAALEQAESENNALRSALYDEHHGITHSLRVALFEEAIETILNLAPSVRKDRGGCFGSRQADCGCTVCKIRRWLALEGPNVRSQATDADLSRQVACTDGLGLAPGKD